MMTIPWYVVRYVCPKADQYRA